MPLEVTNLFKANCKRLAMEVSPAAGAKATEDIIFPSGKRRRTEFVKKAFDIVNVVKFFSTPICNIVFLVIG